MPPHKPRFTIRKQFLARERRTRLIFEADSLGNAYHIELDRQAAEHAANFLQQEATKIINSTSDPAEIEKKIDRLFSILESRHSGK